jgi:hypothetical protein
MAIGCGVLLLLARCALAAQSGEYGDFYYWTDGSSITIVQYTRCWPPSGDAVTIPDRIEGLPVTDIGGGAFWECYGPTSVEIPSSVTNILFQAFGFSSVRALYFRGTPPRVDGGFLDGNVTAYYLPGTTGWGSTFAGRPTALWALPNPVVLSLPPSFGMQTNQFGFVISWATNASVVVEACTDLAKPTWSAVGTNTLNEGWSYFSDPQWTNHPSRFYRIHSP